MTPADRRNLITAAPAPCNPEAEQRALGAALCYAALGWPVSPWATRGNRKFPLTSHGHLDATADPAILKEWWTRWPYAIPAITTGQPSGVVALDIDIRPGGSGFDSLGELAIVFHPEGPRTHTPRGGCAVLFRWPAYFVKTCSGELAPHLDIRADGGSLILPPGPGRFWDPHLGPDTALPPMPEWMRIVSQPIPQDAAPFRPQRLSRYAEAALDAAVKAITSAPDGTQRDTLNSKAYGIGGLAAGGVSPAGLALEALLWAARQVRSYDLRRPWRAAELDKIVRRAFPMGSCSRVRGNGGRRMSPDFAEYEEIKARQTTDNDDSTWADLPAAAPRPKLDDAAYHGLPGKIVKTIEPHSESDPVAILIQFLVMVGNAIGRVLHFLVESDRHSLNLFAILVGETADGRKGVSGGRVSHVMGGADSDWANQRILKGMASGEGLIWAVRDPLKQPTKSGKEASAKFVDTVIDPGVKDKRLMVFEHEFCRALAVMKRPGNTLSAVVRDAWDGNNLGTLTKNSPTRATGAHISIIGHITPDELRAELDRTSMVNGFANRFLFVAVKRSKRLPFGGNLAEDDVRELSYRTHGVLESIRTCSAYRRIGFAEPTRPIWERQYETLSAARPGLVGSITARAPAQTMRLATLYALLDERNVIDPAHLAAATAVWNYCEATTRYVFGDALGDYVADEILQALRKCPDGMTRTEISNLFGRNVAGGKIAEALRMLMKHGKAHPANAKSNGQGQPPEVWHAI